MSLNILVLCFIVGCASNPKTPINIYNYNDENFGDLNEESFLRLLPAMHKGVKYKYATQYYMDRIDEVKIKEVKPPQN